MADQCARLEDRPILAYAAIFGSEFAVVQNNATPFIFLEGLKPKHWQDPDASLYRVTVRPLALRFTLLERCERLKFLPFHTESPPLFYIFRRNPLFNVILTALNQLYHEHTPPDTRASTAERFTVRYPRLGEA